MDQKTKIEYSIKTSELKSPGRHFKFTYSSTDYNHPTNSVLSPKSTAIKGDAFDLFTNQFSKTFYTSKGSGVGAKATVKSSI